MVATALFVPSLLTFAVLPLLVRNFEWFDLLRVSMIMPTEASEAWITAAADGLER